MKNTRASRILQTVIGFIVITAFFTIGSLFADVRFVRAQLPPIDPRPPIDTPLPPWEPPMPVEPATPVTVESYSVNAVVDGAIASVQIRQVLRNDSAQVAEGTYIFPLPANATASSLTLEIDGQMVEGKLYPAGEARDIYEEIVRSLRDPALLEWLDHGLFQMSVFPIAAGEERVVELTYEQPVPLALGLHNLVIPLRAYATGASMPENVNISVELANQPSLRTIYSPSHTISSDRTGNEGALIGFEGAGADALQNFSLYWGSESSAIGANLLSYKPAGEDGFLMLLVAPSVEMAEQEIVERDIVVVLDISGSMKGPKMTQAQNAVDYVVGQLNEGDRFNLITFSTGSRLWQSSLQEVDGDSVADARAWIARANASGSTDINRALLEAMAQLDTRSAREAARPAYILFMTDGLPTQGETDARRIAKNALVNAPANRTLRLFTFGVGYDVNTDLLDTLSRELGGRSSYVAPNQEIDEIVSEFYNQIGKPVLSNVEVDFGDNTVVDELFPYPLPDLFAGEQLLVVGRYRAGGTQDITLTGEVNGREITYAYPDQVLAEAGGEPLVARLWATRKMGALLDQIRREGADQELIDAVVELSLEYGIVSPYTSYLVLESGMTASGADGPTSGADGGGFGNILPADAALPAAASARAEAFDEGARIMESAASEAASGQAAVENAAERDFLANATNVRSNESVRYVAGKALVQRGWVEGADGRALPLWVDTAWDGETEPEIVPFGSDRYFVLAADTEIAQWLSVAPEMVIVLDDGTVVRITTVEVEE